MTHAFRRGGLGYLAKHTKQDHETSRAAAGDLCKITAESAWLWLLWADILSAAANKPLSKKHSQE